jgi:hypothetical protein
MSTPSENAVHPCHTAHPYPPVRCTSKQQTDHTGKKPHLAPSAALKSELLHGFERRYKEKERKEKVSIARRSVMDKSERLRESLGGKVSQFKEKEKEHPSYQKIRTLKTLTDMQNMSQ